MATGVYNTPVKILRTSVDDCCRAQNVHFATYGCIGRFNLFEGKNSRERNVAGRLSLVLGFPVNKESGVSSVICIKCKRELEKLETLENSLTKFRQKVLESAAAQREWGYAVERAKRCHAEKFQRRVRRRVRLQRSRLHDRLFEENQNRF